MYNLTKKLELIKQIPIFSGMDIVQQRVLAVKTQVEYAERDQVIFDEGEIGNKLYLITSGQVSVLKRNPPYDWHQIAALGPGDFFGEIALLRSVPRTARITAHTSCEFLILEAKDFLDSYKQFPASVRDNIQIVVTKRLQELNRF